MRHPFLLFMAALLLCGCGNGRRAVGEGWIQKRTHRPGWHIDIPWRTSDRSARIAPVERPDGTGTEVEMMVPLAGIGHPGTPTPSPLPAGMPIDVGRRASTHPVPGDPAPIAHRVKAPQPQDREDEPVRRERFSWLAIPALLLVIAAIVLGFVSNSALLVAGILAVGIALALLSLARANALHERGRGFALAALVLGALTALLVLMMIVRTGF